MTKPADETLRIVWCPTCRAYLGEPNTRRTVLLHVAGAHTQATGHGVWLEAVDGAFADRSPARRRYDPARADDRSEERLRGGTT